MSKQNIPGLSLAITYQGNVLKIAHYGSASIEYDVPVTDSSAFWLASVSKHFTATSIMQLYENAILDLDDGIHKYLPDAPPNWNKITIRHLLTHTSGLPTYSHASFYGHKSAKGTLSAEEIYNNSKKDTLMFTPGADFLYSDEGIFLLGYIVHKISGKSFNEYMQEHIFKPSNMKSAYLMDHFTIHPNQVTGYSMRDGEIVSDRNSYRLIDTELNPAGGIYATINDMINWEYTMSNNLLLTQKSKDLMWSSYHLNNDLPTYYGFCWNTQIVQDKRIIYHPGVAGTEYLRLVDDSLSIIVLTNQAKYQRAISQHVAEILSKAPIYTKDDVKTAEVSDEQPRLEELEELIGAYEFIPNTNYYLEDKIRMDFVIENNELLIEYPAKQEFRKKIKLAKLKNGRWIQLSWEPAFVETSYQVSKHGSEITIQVFEYYNPEYGVQVGELIRL